MSTLSKPTLTLLSSPDWKDYTLLDSGDGQKLEQFGPYRFVRPDIQALWRPLLPEAEWKRAQASFRGGDLEEGSGRWQFHASVERRWPMQYKTIRFWAEATPFRHLGVFPEQANHWDWSYKLIKDAKRPIRVLNLFGYTGLASLIAAAAGAQVTHVDASKKTVTWAHDNQLLAGLEDKPIRWIVDDALKFVRREVRRGVRYDGFIIDPPKFGRGPDGELWKLEESLPLLLEACKELLSDQPLFFVITTYAIRASSLSLYYLLESLLGAHHGTVSAGEMVLTEQSGKRLLPTSMYARWEANNKK